MSRFLVPCTLNIVEDFFNWLYDTIAGLIEFIQNGVNALIGMNSFISAFASFFTQTFAYLPAIASVIISTTIVVLLVKLVIGR